MTTTEMISLIGVCGSILVGLGGILVAVVTLYVNYRARTSHFRQALYAKQIDGYVDVYQALTKWERFAQSYICQVRCVLSTDDQRIELRLETKNLHLAFAEVHAKWMLFLPEKVNKALGNFQRVFNAISAPSSVARSYPQALVHSSDPGMDLHNAYAAFIEAARTSIGTDRLTKEVLEMLDPSREQIERVQPSAP